MQPTLLPSSLCYVHEKIQGQAFSNSAFTAIIHEINEGLYSPPQIAAFLTACAAHDLSHTEILGLTNAMVGVGPILQWDKAPIIDKHCIGGLPGNRTTPIIVAVLAALGMTIPKTSSRAITSAAGTADAMEVLAPVDLSLLDMRRVVETEGGCVVWGGAVGLSPVDDDMVRVAREIGVDSEGQLVASILSKKLSAGSTHIIIDIPVGPTAKIQSYDKAIALRKTIIMIGKALNVVVAVEITDGVQPIGRGIGPALEARDLIDVLQNSGTSCVALRNRAMLLAGKALELCGATKADKGFEKACACLSSGKAWHKFQSICQAQGGMRDIPKARFVEMITATMPGKVSAMNNKHLSRLARLAGAPEDKTAGVELFVELGTSVSQEEPIFALYSNSKPRLSLAKEALQQMIPIKIQEDHK